MRHNKLSMSIARAAVSAVSSSGVTNESAYVLSGSCIHECLCAGATYVFVFVGGCRMYLSRGAIFENSKNREKPNIRYRQCSVTS